MLRQLYRKVLPARVRKAARILTAGEPSLSVEYELASGWPPEGNRSSSSWRASSVAARLKGGLETFDLERARSEPDAALASPIVRDNFELLRRTELGGDDAVSLLDFGCGNALYRPLLAHHALTSRWRYTGADVNADLVKWCRETFPGARFEAVEEGRPLPFGDGEFDVVLASGVVQCVADYASVVSELRRVAAGFVLASRIPVWKYHATRVVTQRVSHAWGRESHAVHVFNRDALDEFFARAGFSILFRDYGSEIFNVPGVSEPAVHHHYLLRKI